MKPEDYIGKVCVCTHGKIGVVKDIRKDSQGFLYIGTRVLLKGRPWQTRSPVILDIEDADTIRKSLENAVEAPVSPVVKEEVADTLQTLQDAPVARRKRVKPKGD